MELDERFRTKGGVNEDFNLAWKKSHNKSQHL